MSDWNVTANVCRWSEWTDLTMLIEDRHLKAVLEECKISMQAYFYQVRARPKFGLDTRIVTDAKIDIELHSFFQPLNPLWRSLPLVHILLDGDWKPFFIGQNIILSAQGHFPVEMSTINHQRTWTSYRNVYFHPVVIVTWLCMLFYFNQPWRTASFAEVDAMPHASLFFGAWSILALATILASRPNLGCAITCL